MQAVCDYWTPFPGGVFDAPEVRAARPSLFDGGTRAGGVEPPTFDPKPLGKVRARVFATPGDSPPPPPPK